MRAFEIVQRDLAGGRVVVIDAPDGEHLSAALRLAEGVEVGAAPDDDSQLSGLLVLAADASADDGRIARMLGRLGPGADAVILLGEAPSALPVGRLVDALVTSGVQVRGVAPLAAGRWSLAVSVTRTERLLPLRSYLFGVPEVQIGHPQLLRLVAEHALEGLALRSRMVGEGAVQARDVDATVSEAAARAREIKALRVELDAARADLERSRAGERRLAQRVEHLERSASLAIGRAVVSMRRHPVGGARELAAVVRRRRLDTSGSR